MNKWTRPFEGNSAAGAPGGSANSSPAEHHYFAFLSYAHADSADADWLHQELERFRVPSSLAGRLTANGVIPKRLAPIFRDRHELAASHDLGAEIRHALELSRCLVVLCSPAAATSKWVNAEVDQFKRIHPEGCIIAAVVAGEPLASDVPGREDEECFPPALVAKYNRRGAPTGQKTEPLAADLREGKGARRTGFLKIVAGMLGVGLDELVQREHVRRQRRLAFIAAASLGGMVVTSTLAVAAIQARDEAREQRSQAEDLVGFMLGDLREKLEPIGRLDTLDAVASRALGYFEKQETSELSDEALRQRAKALTLMGEIAQTRGNLDLALRFYRTAYTVTDESLRRNPESAERLFDHAQNVFWVGYIARQRGRLDDAASAFAHYRSLANAMIALEPTNAKWKLERAYAVNGLGVTLLDQHRYQQASAAFQEGLETSEALAASEPDNWDYQYRLLEALAWFADSKKVEGRLEDALAQRERQLALLQQWTKERPGDQELSRKAMTAHRELGNLLAARGDVAGALHHARTGAVYADGLIKTEPANTEWLEFAAKTKLDLGDALRMSGELGSAAAAIRAGCDIQARLLAKNASVRSWKEDLQLKCLLQRVRLALAAGSGDEAVAIANELVRVAKSTSGSTATDAAAWRAVAYDLLGDSLATAGRRSDAAAARAAAVAVWPHDVTLSPDWMAAGAKLLRSAGETAAATRLSEQLKDIGYRHPDFVRTFRGG